LGGGGVRVVDGGDGVADFLEAARHVRAHSADADEGDFGGHRFSFPCSYERKRVVFVVRRSFHSLTLVATKIGVAALL